MFNLPKLYYGYFLKRYKRFFVDIDFKGTVLTAHNPNTGSMRNLLKEGREVAFSKSDNPKRKLKYTLESFRVDNCWVYTNTIKVNKIVENALRDGEITELNGFRKVIREYTILNSKLDFCIDIKGQRNLVEVKSVSLFDESYAMFPDAVTTRGQRHLRTLKESVEMGYKAYVLYIIQSDRKKFRCADEIDSRYCEIFEETKKAGVNVLLYRNVMDIGRNVCYLERLD
ncbi:DNA/RNA nuclease SfsA [Flexistipes sp.]|uniref:DNA/RNA nuclease SfsA n=1 Tax=Flexistipes sp. TaxID=3088135 RepID=UPI002E213AE9|nr:DNA/RNA nuclease SfsA [Flexistipes sp.]